MPAQVLIYIPTSAFEQNLRCFLSRLFDFYLPLIFPRLSSGKNIIRANAGPLCNPGTSSSALIHRHFLICPCWDQIAGVGLPACVFDCLPFWLNAVPKLSCQNRLTSLSPTGLHHTQVCLVLPTQKGGGQ